MTGCNIFYHLVTAGWRDVALFERKELTAEAIWHSFGHVAHFTLNPHLIMLRLQTSVLLDRLDRETGQPFDVVHVGSFRIATHRAGFDDFTGCAETTAGVSCGTHMVSAREAKHLKKGGL